MVLLQQYLMVNHVVSYHHVVSLGTHTRSHVVLELRLLLLQVHLVLVEILLVNPRYVVVGLLLLYLLVLGLVSTQVLLYMELQGYQYQLNAIWNHVDYILYLLLA